jgi:hypothetical protein
MLLSIFFRNQRRHHQITKERKHRSETEILPAAFATQLGSWKD